IDEIGIEPGPDLQRLHQRMLAGDPGLAITSVSELAAAPARLAPPRHLPPPLQGFVGRAARLRELADLLDARAADDGPTMIGVISGPAGVGKTALAVHWAHQAAGAFPDGQLYLDLNGFSPAGTPVTEAEAISKVFEALRVPAGRIPAGLPGQAGFYRD